jgi:NAD(P)-dependent dehydrogenase (short-subunit alcohol dehydrogenase family)
MARWRAQLDGEVAVVTGGAAGIGRAIVAELSRAGARVHVLDRERGEAEGDVTWHRVDLRSSSAVAQTIARSRRSTPSAAASITSSTTPG